MLISKPLLAPNDNFAPEFVTHGLELLSGVYPVGPGQMWHGGCHLRCPASKTHDVRAIADGTLVGYRVPTKPPTDPAALAEHPLNYGGGWTDDGFVLLKHTKESGERVPVVFYSLYMHLSKLGDNKLFTGKPGVTTASTGKIMISRKDKLGELGQIYGQKDSMHFEIFTDDASFKQFFKQSPSGDGAMALWGDVYFTIPPGTPYTLDTPKAGQTVETPHKTEEKLFVSIGYDRGNRILKAYRSTGEKIGEFTDPGAEYQLYKRAQQWFPKNTSAGYELLRVGRKIGPDALPAIAPNWQQVPLGFGPLGWIDLNQPSIRKRSDADFPEELWRPVQENGKPFNTADSKCDAPELIRIFDPDKDGTSAPLELKRALADKAFQERAQSLVCLFPSEWDYPDDGAVKGKLGWVEDYFKNPASREKELAEKQKAWISTIKASTETQLAFLEKSLAETKAGLQRHEAHQAELTKQHGELEKASKAAALDEAKHKVALSKLRKQKKTPPATLEKAETENEEAHAKADQAKTAFDENTRDLKADTIAISDSKSSIQALGKEVAAAKDTLAREAKALVEADKAIAAATEALKQPPKDAKKAWEAFTKHVLALKWWNNLAGTCGLGNPTVWHFHPLAFIEHYRKCGWLSKDEFISLNPRRVKDGGKFTSSLTYEDIETRITDAGDKRPAGIYPQICKMMLKYGITTPLRIAHFMGQISQETGQLEFMVEKGADSYFDKYDKDTKKGKELGNTQKDDGKRFKGRGLIQLTGRGNYAVYQYYRNANYTTDPNPTLLATNAYATCDAAGYYWTSKQRMATSTKKNGEQGINYWADFGSSEGAKKEVTKGVNPPMNHYVFRSQYFEHAYYVLNDLTISPAEYQPIEPK